MITLNRFSVLFLLTFITVSVFCQENNRSFSDALNREITFEKVPERVITLAPSLTEFIYAIRCEDRLIGNTLYCNYPEQAKNITKIGDILTFDYERILSLNPDLVLITIEGNTKESFDKIESLGLKTFVLNPRNTQDIKQSMKTLSIIFHKEQEADNIIKNWDKEIDKIITINKSNQSRSSMVIIDINPLMLAGANTFINEYLEFCNLTNITKDSPDNYPVYSREEILKKDPDLMIYPCDGTVDVNLLLSYYPEWKELKAIKNNNVIFVDRDSFSRPGPRFVEALKELSLKIN